VLLSPGDIVLKALEKHLAALVHKLTACCHCHHYNRITRFLQESIKVYGTLALVYICTALLSESVPDFQRVRG